LGYQPADLGERGQQLWADLSGQLAPAQSLLLAEMCRTADRLDRLDRLLRGDEDAWLRFRSMNDDGSVIEIIVNNLLGEARQQQVALKQMLGEFRQAGAAAGVKQPEPQGGSFRDELRAKRQARIADAAGS
jgi:hypothetical protein